MNNNQLELIIGENLADVLVKDEANILIKSIKELRNTMDYVVPLVHITDEIKIDKNSYEIRDLNKKILKQSIAKSKEYNALVEEIIKNLDEICKVK